jgi:hypothetical protein
LPTGESPAIAELGYLQSCSGASVGTGPVPKKVRVGFPRNIVSPSTVPHGLKSDSAVTSPVGWGGSVVEVVEVGTVVCDGSLGSVDVVAGGSVVTDSAPGSAAMTFSPPATHDAARSEHETRRSAALRIAASVGTGPR